VGQLTAASKVAQLTDMLAKLVTALTHRTTVDTACEPLRPLAQSPGEAISLCWECGKPGHFQRYCPLTSRGLNYRDRNRRRLPPPRPTAREVSPARAWHGERVRVQHHGNSYFLPGKIAGKAATFLLDSGCTTNLISRQLFDTLSARVRSEMEPYDGEYGTLADGLCIPFYGIIKLTGRVRNQAIQETFIVSQLKEDAILGMPFLKRHGCHIDFSKSAVVMSGQELACVDKFDRLLVGGVQVVRNCTIPGCSRATIHCRVNNSQIFGLGVVEGVHDKIQLASSLNQLTARREILVQCVNPFTESVKLPAGSMLGCFHSVQEEDVGLSLGDTAEGPQRRPSKGRGTVPPHVKELYETACDGCASNEKRQAMAKLLHKYNDVFSSGDHDVGLTRGVCHEIPLAAGKIPIRQPTRRFGPEKEKEVSQQVHDLLDHGLIEPAHSAWSSPVALVRKKDGSWRFCVDYHKLKSVTIQDAYPLPQIDESLDALAGSKYFSMLDLLSKYWQVPLSPDAQEKAVFITRDGLRKWKVLPFGLTSAPATFQRLMEQVLSGLHWKTLLIYLDDVIMISPDFQTHVSHLREVFERLRGAGLKLKPFKCALLQPGDKYLGHVVSRNGVATDPEKVRAIEDWVIPQDLTGLRAFLGLVEYYRQYIPDFAGIAQPLNRLPAKGVTWQWSPVEWAFDHLKGCLLAAPVLAYPDSALEYILDTDASDQNVGAVLLQVHEGREAVVAYYSKSLPH